MKVFGACSLDAEAVLPAGQLPNTSRDVPVLARAPPVSAASRVIDAVPPDAPAGAVTATSTTMSTGPSRVSSEKRAGVTVQPLGTSAVTWPATTRSPMALTVTGIETRCPAKTGVFTEEVAATPNVLRTGAISLLTMETEVGAPVCILFS